MRVLTAILLLLFDHNQPYKDAKRITGDVILELLETKLDEGLSYLDGEGTPRRARETIQIRRAFGSMENFVKEGMQKHHEAPTIPLA
jgi:hypothetical protein